MLRCPRCGKDYPDDVHVCPLDLTPLRADATLADVPLDPLIGRVLDGKYRLDELLGSGGMGTVYRATHLLIDRAVAVKVLSQRFVDDDTAKQRFHREGRAAGKMQHPNAVSVTDFGATTDGYLYIVMELLQGRTLRELLARERPLDVARAVSIMLQTCAAVGAAHDAGLIHRDLKPGNIFIEQRPNQPAVVKVLDFGVAKFAVEEQADDDYQTLTQVGAIIGTPRYMSPEQCSGSGAVTPASDVYSLGIILYEMLAGVVPFNAETPLAIALRHVSEPPQLLREVVPSIPERIEAIVDAALAKSPTKRFVNANELRRELFAAAQESGFEHAESTGAPTLDTFRDSGRESPSGSLVVNLAAVRQAQAAFEHSEESGNYAATPPHQVVTMPPVRREISRLNIGLDDARKRKPAYVIAALILIVAILGAAVVAARWWRVDNIAGIASAPTPPPTPTATPSPVASPSPSPSPGPTASRRPARPKQPSRVKKVWDKVKGIFK